MYYPVFALLYLLSLLPWRVLYALSDIVCFVLYNVMHYRKAVVDENLQHAFPDRTTEERHEIARRFYKCFCDNWIETVKLMSVTKKSLRKRCSGDLSLFAELHAKGTAVQGNFGHFFNWELQNHYMGIGQPYTMLGVYFPQKSVVMDRVMHYIRSRWNNVLIPMPEMARRIIPWRKKQYLLALIGDQSPVSPGTSWWLNFMNRPACFVKGPEKFARGQNIPVTFTITTRPKRGYYHFEPFLITNDPSSLPEGEIMRRYVRALEDNIRRQPELYLWSHRRWKHPWQNAYAPQWIDETPAPL